MSLNISTRPCSKGMMITIEGMWLKLRMKPHKREELGTELSRCLNMPKWANVTAVYHDAADKLLISLELSGSPIEIRRWQKVIEFTMQDFAREFNQTREVLDQLDQIVARRGYLTQRAS